MTTGMRTRNVMTARRSYKNFYLSGHTVKETAKKFGVSVWIVSRIINNNHWTTIQ